MFGMFWTRARLGAQYQHNASIEQRHAASRPLGYIFVPRRAAQQQM